MKKRKKIIITKASSKSVEFSESKLRSSLARVGAKEEQIDRIVTKLSVKFYKGISTKKNIQDSF